MTEHEKLHSTNTFMLPTLLESVAEAFNLEALRKGLQILLDVAPDACLEVRGDEAKLRAILTEAIENGLDSAEEGALILGAGLADWSRQTVTVRFKIVFTYEEVFANLARAQELVGCLGGKLTTTPGVERGSILSFAIPLERVERKSDWDGLTVPA